MQQNMEALFLGPKVLFLYRGIQRGCMEIKRCDDCGRFLGEKSFHWLNKKKGYRQSCCKRCNSNRSYLWRLNNKDHIREYKKIWRKNNEEHIVEYHKNWSKNNREHLRGYRTQYRRDNREHIREYHKQYYENNREKCLEYSRQCYKDDPEYRKQYQKDNPEKMLARKAKRRVAKKNQTVALTNIEKDKYKFIYKVASTMANYVVDHIQPISKGGSDHPDNLQILRKDLNREKYNKYPLTGEERVKYTGFKL